jgi:hypothetical protein
MALTRLGPNNSTNISGINLTSQVTGTLPTANGGTGATSFTAGKILQVVSAKKTSNFNTSSTSFVDVGLEATITPSATSSKIAVTLDTGGMTRNGVSNECPRIKILRAGSDNYGGDNIFFTSDSLSYSGVSTSFHYIDEPSSTSSLLYKVQMQTRLGNDCGFAAGSSAQFASLILMEISG